MSFSLSVTEANLMQAVGDFLTTIMPPGLEIVRGQDNRVPLPAGPDWIAITPILRPRLATNIDTWDGQDADPITTSVLTYTEALVQVDCFGPNAHNNSTVILMLFRDEFAVEQFAASGFDITPLYTSEPRNLTFINDQKQYENRWSFDLTFEVNAAMSVPQQFADTLSAGIISVDERYPPTGA